MLNSSYHHNSLNPSQPQNGNRDVEHLLAQGDAIYDYERMPAAGWTDFDDQTVVYQYGDASAWQNVDEDTE